jgi:hypothetical protein
MLNVYRARDSKPQNSLIASTFTQCSNIITLSLLLEAWPSRKVKALYEVPPFL